MSCCPKAPIIATAADSLSASGSDQEMRPGESAECFSLRAGNSTGLVDDAEEIPLEKIANESIEVDCEAKVDVQFKLTEGSISTGVQFSMSGDDTPGVTLTSAGRLHGTFANTVHGKKLTIKVIASSGETALDERTYIFSPEICKGSTSIKFVFPLPGGKIGNRGYGWKFHPIQKKMKFHSGIDMSISPNVAGDVVAAADGVIIKARNTDPRGYGNSVHIKHFNANGKHLCTTTYNHLALPFFVTENDKVVAGQKIGREGSSGGSTGLHLHFECRLPNGSFIDPAPYLREATVISVRNIALTSANITAKQSCPPMGKGTYPGDPNYPEPPVGANPPGGSNDPFEIAWYFTMKWEVGPLWNTLPGAVPTNPDVISGLCETNAQKKACGYKIWNSKAGGETKFGIAKSAWPQTDIKALTYAEAKKIGYQNYWNRGVIKPVNLPKYIGIFMFDTNFQHGPGGGNTIYTDANVSSVPVDASKEVQMAAIEKLYKRRLQFASTLNDVKLHAGAINRVNDIYRFIKSLA